MTDGNKLQSIDSEMDDNVNDKQMKGFSPIHSNLFVIGFQLDCKQINISL